MARTCAAAACGLLICALAGCDQPITMSKYDRITQGMTPEEVQQVLGRGQTTGGVVAVSSSRPTPRAGAEPRGGRRVLMWHDGERRIIVAFRDSKVISKQKQGF